MRPSRAQRATQCDGSAAGRRRRGDRTTAHARGAVIGDAMASLMEFCGWNVTREYYVNDAGGQVDVLARSAYLRYCEALGQDIGDIPSGLYPGDYLKDVGKALAKRGGCALSRPT